MPNRGKKAKGFDITDIQNETLLLRNGSRVTKKC